MSRSRVPFGQEILTKEIDEIADIVGSNLTKEIKETATRIAIEYIQQNVHADPETLARASFYIALKEYKCNPEKSVNAIITNHGKENRWWLYMAPLLEKQVGSKKP